MSECAQRAAEAAEQGGLGSRVGEDDDLSCRAVGDTTSAEE